MLNVGPPTHPSCPRGCHHFQCPNPLSLSLSRSLARESGIPCISDCVMAELEKLGQKYRLALRLALSPSPSPSLPLVTFFPLLPPPPPYRLLTPISPPCRVARDPRFERLPCSHKGTYADDCIVNRVNSHRCYIVATCDRALRRRLRKIPGVPVR